MRAIERRLPELDCEFAVKLGKPRVYDHDYAGCSRRDLLRSAWTSEGHAEYAAGFDPEGHAAQIKAHAQKMRDAIEFFDHIGWLTPLRLREQAADPEGHA
jgi:hypothetical protein